MEVLRLSLPVKLVPVKLPHRNLMGIHRRYSRRLFFFFKGVGVESLKSGVRCLLQRYPGPSIRTITRRINVSTCTRLINGLKRDADVGLLTSLS